MSACAGGLCWGPEAAIKYCDGIVLDSRRYSRSTASAGLEAGICRHERDGVLSLESVSIWG